MTKTDDTAPKPRRMARSPKPSVKPASHIVNAEPNPDAPGQVSKQDMVIGLLLREGGAVLTELVEATGWLPHTARAALTGLRKKGQKVIAVKAGKVTRYSIAGE